MMTDNRGIKTVKYCNACRCDRAGTISVRLAVLTYLLHAAVLLEKLTGSHLVKKLPEFYGTRRFITAFTSVHYLSIS